MKAPLQHNGAFKHHRRLLNNYFLRTGNSAPGYFNIVGARHYAPQRSLQSSTNHRKFSVAALIVEEIPQTTRKHKCGDE